MSINWLSDAEPRAALLVLPPDAVSLDEAHAAIELWEHYSRKTLDPAQRLSVEVMMAENAAGRWAARTTGREVPRQNGKGEEIEVVELWGLTQRGEVIGHTAHELPTVSRAFVRMMGLFGHRDLARLKLRELNGLGQQMIEMRNGGQIAYRTRTSGGLRGLDDISRLVIDEAQHAQPEQMASSTPTLLANPNPQMNFIGTGGIAGVSDWWWQQRLRALSDDPGEFGYVGHTAEKVYLDDAGQIVQEPVDPLDEELWMMANPVLWTDRGDIGYFREQLRNLGSATLFAREHLGVWDPPASATGPRWSVIAKDDWAAGAVVDTEPGPLRYSLDVDSNAKGEEWASVACSDGTLLEDITPTNAPVGTGWVVSTLTAMKETVGMVLIAKDSPAAKLIDPLRANGVGVQEVTAPEFAAASQQGLDLVAARGHKHLSQPRLTRAAAGAVCRDVGDGARKLSRKLSGDDISPLCAAFMARWGATQPSSSRELFAVWA